MEELKNIIDLLKKISLNNGKAFDECPEVKLSNDIEYNNLYRAYFLSDFKLKRLIELLEVVEKNLSYELNGCKR